MGCGCSTDPGADPKDGPLDKKTFDSVPPVNAVEAPAKAVEEDKTAEAHAPQALKESIEANVKAQAAVDETKASIQASVKARAANAEP